MCDKIEELEKKIADLERTNDLLRTLVKKKDARIEELHEDYDELNDISIELTEENNELKKANDILTKECNNALMLNDKHGGEAKDLKKENEKLKREYNAYVQENLDLYKAKEKLENENKRLQYYVDDWTDRAETNQNLFERSCDHVTRLEKENEDLKKQLANALDLYDERGEVIEKHEELKASLKTILNFIYGVDTDGDKIEHLERENESLRKTNAELVNRFGGDTDCIIRSIMVNGGKI